MRFRLKSLRAGIGPLAAEIAIDEDERDRLHLLSWCSEINVGCSRDALTLDAPEFGETFDVELGRIDGLP